MKAAIAMVVAASVAMTACASGSSGPKTVGSKLANDISTVVAGVQTVQTEVGLAVKSGSQSDVNQLAQGADQVHTSLTDMKDQIALDAPNNTAGADLTSAVNELKNSMAALGTYTGNPNPSTLASFTNQYQTAVADWDSSVQAIYAGTASTPPSSLGSAG